jgi:predicted PurR-regulated permease PerM
MMTTRSSLENKTFRYLLIGVSLAFAAILWPFYAAVFWAMVLAILFAPLFRWMLTITGGKPTRAALVTLMVVVLIVILPLVFLGISLVREGSHFFQKIQSGELNFALYFQKIVAVLPSWIGDALDRLGLGNLTALQTKVGAMVAQGSQFLTQQAIGIGHNTFDFVMAFFITLYLTFFLLRDGEFLSRRIADAIRLDGRDKTALLQMFTTVIRATVKGNVVMALMQGALGGLAFWVLGLPSVMLWATVMAFLSLLPAVGAALIWLPVALYFLGTGAVWQGAGLAAFGVLVMSLLDNLLRPVLVGKDSKLPDYVVLMSTLGGMALLGLNGFVIGPMVAAMFMAVWGIFLNNQAQPRGSHDDPLR